MANDILFIKICLYPFFVDRLSVSFHLYCATLKHLLTLFCMAGRVGWGGVGGGGNEEVKITQLGKLERNCSCSYKKKIKRSKLKKNVAFVWWMTAKRIKKIKRRKEKFEKRLAFRDVLLI